MLIRPFVPAKDFTFSRAFYAALGFREEYADDAVAIFEGEGAGFLLQNFYVQAFAENCMNQLFVCDLDDWWRRTAALAERFAMREPIAPAMQPWGIRVGFLFDPSGVLWHVAKPPSA